MKTLALNVKVIERFKFSKIGHNPRVIKVGIHRKISKNTQVKYQSSGTHSSKILSKLKVFKKVGPRSRSQGIVTRNYTHVRYQSSSTYG